MNVQGLTLNCLGLVSRSRACTILASCIARIRVSVAVVVYAVPAVPVGYGLGSTISPAGTGTITGAGIAVVLRTAASGPVACILVVGGPIAMPCGVARP